MFILWNNLQPYHQLEYLWGLDGTMYHFIFLLSLIYKKVWTSIFNLLNEKNYTFTYLWFLSVCPDGDVSSSDKYS